MKKYILIILTFFSLQTILFSQVGINTNTVQNGVMLEVNSNQKGVLLPRVALQSRTSTSPLGASIPTGTVVFNTATTGTFPNTITPGLHWWSAEDQQWTNFSTDSNNLLMKYTNSESGTSTTNYNTTNLVNVKLFGNRIINESSAVYSVNTTDQSVTINNYGLYSISTLLSMERQDDGDHSRQSLTARIYVNGTGVGTEQVYSPGYIASDGGIRGLFSHAFTEYLVLNDGDVVTVKIKRTDGSYSSGYGDAPVRFYRSGDSSISIQRIR